MILFYIYIYIYIYISRTPLSVHRNRYTTDCIGYHQRKRKTERGLLHLSHLQILFVHEFCEERSAFS